MEKLRVGVDIGGTFTDLVAYDENLGKFLNVKVPTTLQPEEGIINALKRIYKNQKILIFSHSTTIATNALLTKQNWSRVALITTKGYRDVLEIGRQRRPEIYNLKVERPIPIVPRELRLVVDEAIDANGNVIKPLNMKDLDEILDELRNVDIIAVSLINSYKNNSHETMIRDYFSKKMNIPVIISSEIDPLPKEFERTSTTVINALLYPIVSRYLEKLEKDVENLIGNVPIYIMQSDGGLNTIDSIIEKPISIIESGPSSGVLASLFFSKLLKIKNLLTFDMGGTTAKAGIIYNYNTQYSFEFEAAGKTHSGRSIKGSGYTVRFPFIDLAETSSGGGSIAWIDEGNALRVGPKSAGSYPGPVCYDLGGNEPTITDANLILGRLNPDHILAGEMKLNYNKAYDAIKKLSEKINLDVFETALGIIKIANNQMSKIMKIVSIERGYDPRDFQMIAFGGAGPLHAVDIASDLEVKSVIIPPNPGLFSALGLVVSDLKREYVKPLMSDIEKMDDNLVEELFSEMEKNAMEDFEKSNVKGDIYFIRQANMQYLGQGFELDITLRKNNIVENMKDDFNKKHKGIYRYSSDDPIFVVSLRLTAILKFKKPNIPAIKKEGNLIKTKRKVYFSEEPVEAEIYERSSLAHRDNVEGPAIIEQYDSTTLIPPGWKANIDKFSNIVIRRL